MRKAKILLLIGFVLLCSACGQKPDVIWNAGGEVVFRCPDLLEDWGNQLIEIFNVRYPNISVRMDLVPGDVDVPEYVEALAVDIASEDSLDIFISNKQTLGMVKELDCCADLSGSPYDYDETKLVEYLSKYLHDAKDRLIGLPVGIQPTVYCYRTDLSQQYLGTGDPDELAGILSNWDAYIQWGETVQNTSGGSVHLFSSLYGICKDVWKSNPLPWYQDDDILIAKNYMDQLRVIDRMLKANIAADFFPDKSELSRGMAQSTAIIYPCTSDFLQLINQAGGGTDWQLIMPPVSTSQDFEQFIHLSNQAGNREGAYAFIEYLFGTPEGCLKRYTETGELPGLKAMYDGSSLAQAGYSGLSLPMDLYKGYIESADFPQLTPYDSFMLGGEDATQLYSVLYNQVAKWNQNETWTPAKNASDMERILHSMIQSIQ